MSLLFCYTRPSGDIEANIAAIAILSFIENHLMASLANYKPKFANRQARLA